jgi:hypothetical protein
VPILNIVFVRSRRHHLVLLTTFAYMSGVIDYSAVTNVL